MKIETVLKWLSGMLLAVALAVFIFGQPSGGQSGASAGGPANLGPPDLGPATRSPQVTPMPAMVETKVISTPVPYTFYLPQIAIQVPRPSPISTKTEPPAVAPSEGWPAGLAHQTASKLGLHVVRDNDPYIMEFVRRVRPRVMKSVDDLGWLTDVKLASPNTVTIGRISGQDETWPDELAPDAAAREFVDGNLTKYRLNSGVDYWEGWNEYVPVTEAHWKWYAAFEAARACDMQALGYHAAVGGFAAGTPEYAQMALFLPALEAAHRCGGLFTLHEGISPLPDCGLFINQPAVIPGAPAIPHMAVGYLMLRYRFWYEGYLKPMGLGDLPLEISEVAVGGIVPGQPCNGPGGASWKDFSTFWVQNGVGVDGPHAWTNLLAWYDSLMWQDPYVLGTTIFTAGGIPGWDGSDLHDVLIPLAEYETSLN
jgi:hypothetical protein